jgi:predicted ArsR family transcriptional regulator
MTRTTLQEQARALGDPTRHAIFRHLDEADRPIGVAELNDRFPLNHNAIRQHLAKLVDAGLVIEARAAVSGRGRPRMVYEVDPGVGGHWGTSGPYERLSRLLVEIIRSGKTPEEAGRVAADRFRARSPSGDVVDDVAAAMARQGFDPEVRSVPGGAEIVLHSCPFATAAVLDRPTVCALHLGIAEGLVDGTGAAVTELVGYDPRTADCRLRIENPPAEDAAPAALLLRTSPSRRRSRHDREA